MFWSRRKYLQIAAERDHALGQLNETIRQRDIALGERNSFKDQCAKALHERGEFLRQRDIALGERNEFERQLNVLLRKLESGAPVSGREC